MLSKIQDIYKIISAGNYRLAFAKLIELKKENPENPTLIFNANGLLIDIGTGLRDRKIIEEGIKQGKLVLDSVGDNYKNNLHYNLANGYMSLYNLFEHGDIKKIPSGENLQKAKFHFRKAIELSNNQLTPQLLTNYGNCLDALGRSIESIYAYDTALDINPSYSMAIANRAQASIFFADISGEYRGAIYAEAYQEIRSVLDKQDLIEIGGTNAKESFEKEMLDIEKIFKDKDFLNKKLTHEKVNTTEFTQFEKFYLEICSTNKLFLNFHIHDNNCEAALVDPVFISLITSVSDNTTFYRLSKHINQIKEDYATARLLFVQSQFEKSDIERISERTIYVDTLDYASFGLYGGLLKSAYKAVFNILDKIGVFIKQYFNPQSSEKVYFKNIWEENSQLRQQLLETKNISLYALYDIFKDFEKNEHFKYQKDIRNSLTHRRLVIIDDSDQAFDKDTNEIGHIQMISETADLLRLIKAAIIYLINFVNNEEGKKRQDPRKIAPVPVTTL